MDAFVIEIAGASFETQPLFETTALYCRDYLVVREPEYRIFVTREELAVEQRLLDLEADEEGLKRRKFAKPFLERSLIQRKVAECLLERDVLLMHGSAVAVDGQAYLFTAPCGTGKSTHTRLWREAFGERAVMVNDDKPFLRFVEGQVLACGSPWSGKHGLANNVCFPLKGICVLSRGSENVIRPAAVNEISDFLMHQIFRPEGDDRIPGLLAELMDRVPVWEMECNRSPEAAWVSYEAMSCAE
ncbi:MAG: hypothetical protein IJA49_00890 [Oscillospiraceae bacterium]|nr:hypothetical protein [Oscillospiraceae bacterium]